MTQLTLKNGIRVFFTPKEDMKSATVGIWVKSGCENEQAEEGGIAHFIEHIVFKGSKKRTGFQIAEGMDEIGASVNAYTTKEYTFFYVKALRHRIVNASDILFDMLINPCLNEKDIETEKGVILEEIAMYEDDPADVCYEKAEKAIFAFDSLSSEILGTRESVKAITAEKIRDYMKRRYTGENIVIGVSGNFDEAAIKEKIEEYFSFLCPEGERTARDKLPFNCGFTLKKMQTEQTHIALSFKGVGIVDEDLSALQICSFILGTGTSSLLNQRIREDLGLVYSIDSWLGRYRRGGYICVSMSLGPQSEKRAIEETVKIIKSFTLSLTQRKLDIAKERLISSLIMSREQPQSRFSATGYNLLLLGRVIEDEEIISNIEKVTIEAVKKAAEKYLTLDKLNFTAVGKVKTEKEYREILENAIKSGDENE